MTITTRPAACFDDEGPAASVVDGAGEAALEGSWETGGMNLELSLNPPAPFNIPG